MKVKNTEQTSSGKTGFSSIFLCGGLTGFEVMDSTLDCGTRGKTKGCGSLSTQGLSEADLMIATLLSSLLSSSEQRNRIYYGYLQTQINSLP